MKKRFFYKNKNLLYCTFWYMLVLFGYMALDHCTVINSVRPFLFVHKEQFNIICFFLFLNLNTFWVLRFLFLWTFTNSFLRPKKPTTAFLKFSKIWVLFLIYRFLYSDTECIWSCPRHVKSCQWCQSQHNLKNGFVNIVQVYRFWISKNIMGIRLQKIAM